MLKRALSHGLRHIPFRHLDATEIHLRYLEEDPSLVPLLGKRPRSVEDLLKRAPLNTRRLIPPAALSQALLAYAASHEAPDAVRAAAETCADGKTFFVVTGQQPGLFGGPLYSVHKAATAVRLAQGLQAALPGQRVVPIFWNHTEDHDLDEMNRAFLVNQNQEVQRFRLEVQHQGECARDLPVGRALETALAAAADLLPATEFRQQVLEVFRPRHADEHFGDSFARLLYALFGKHGLQVIEPRDLPAEALAVLPKWFEQTGTIRAATRQATDDIADIGLDVTLDPANTLMFERVGGLRQALSDGEPLVRREALSPGVLLRPLWQDACLPTIASVVGPGEIAYMAIAGPLYQKLGVPQPVLVPRASLTLVEPSLQKLLARYHWDLPDLAQGPERLAEKLPLDEQSAVEERLDQVTATLKRDLSDLADKVRDADKAMVGAFERAKSRSLEELQKLLLKVRNSRQNREGTGHRQVRRLCSNLLPKGRLQERVLPPLPFLVTHGFGLADILLGAADPFANAHGMLEL